ncbi:NACHT domain-containing protein [Phormidesmis priestleyi ULC007]|uniref:NACHT domain-containing protein n=1 Tax=Phormidesmis priestleyi ULC007 TaxID=1920490 RepID=A0A2T1DN74_9CYAN|nr:NACHT domain-containing NTPase [Phormidesmis priestleyi]PSB21943.1 NACHT domain-containing protein [Phormidesmis priestleyi ULC007]PZO55088.1 MAG: NACHT domain-containing protein [Phormidesmis priestleyi]
MMERMGRSLQASAIGIVRANKAALVFARKADLADELEISRSTLQKFFSGRPIGRENFHQICQRLKLDWRTIADLPNGLIEPDADPSACEDTSDEDLETLVQSIKQQGRASIQTQCSTIRVLDMSQPIALKDIYTHINILERISGRRRISLDELLKGLAEEPLDRPFLRNVSETRVDGLEAVNRFDKLIVLGRPGVGKTTFLKYLALQCSLGEFQVQRVPMFISIKDFAEMPKRSGLLDYINQQIVGYGNSSLRVADSLLQNGRMLILLDGLDEVKGQDSKWVVQEVQRFSMQYPLNQFVMTCRIATHEYTFEKFTEVEVADFNQSQVSAFVHHWFANKNPALGDWVIEKLQLPGNRSVRELATNPLLLTLLCLIFEDCGESPLNQCELYKEGLEILLKKWDSKRNIEREQVYRKLSLQHKEALLSRIAWLTFNRGDYFFGKGELKRHISDYLSQLSDTEALLKPVHFDSEAVLKSIEAQHGILVERARGIYSFSHLSFHEYFAARELVDSATPPALETSLKTLMKHLNDPRWREVFLLTAGMMHQPTQLLTLMKQQINHLLEDFQLQQCLLWISQKSASISALYQPVVVRAFYLDLEMARLLNSDRLLNLALGLESSLTRQLNPEMALDLALDRALSLTSQITNIADPMNAMTRALNRAIARADNLDPSKTSALTDGLQQLKDQLPEPQVFSDWWHEHEQTWTEQLRMTLISCRDLGHEWQFNPLQMQKLKQYYAACGLLIDCLNSVTNLTLDERVAIEQDFLQPVSQLRHREEYEIA